MVVGALFQKRIMRVSGSVLVTVGTTGFDELIAAVCSEPVVKELARQDFDSIIVQYGSSKSVYSEEMFKKYHVTRFSSCLKLRCM